MRQGLVLGVAVLVLGFAGSAIAGVVVSSTQTKLDTRQASPMTVYIEADRLKVETPDSITIYRADQNRMWAIDPQRRSYMEITPDTMRQMTSQLAGAQTQLDAAQAQLEAQLSQMPPEQAAMMRQMMAGRGLGAPGGRAGGPPAPPQIAYARAGGSKTVATWNCDVFRKTVNGQQEEELCIAPITRAGLTAGDFQVMERFSTFIAPLTTSPMTPKNGYMSWNDMNRAVGFQGVPLDTIIYALGRPSIQQTVTKIERATIPANTFDLPAGLTRQDMGGPQR